FHPPAEALERIACTWHCFHGYVDDQGLLELREKIASDYNPGLDASNLLLTPGANNAFFTLLVTTLNLGDEFILPSPVYFNYAMAIQMLGGRVIEVPCDGGFDLDVEAIRSSITPRTKAIVIISPNNPTGKIYSSEKLKEIASTCRDLGILLVSDETYADFVFKGFNYNSPYEIAREIGTDAVCVSSFSKVYGIPGWRLGYLITSSNVMMQEMLKVQDTLNICAPVPAQYLVLELMENYRDYYIQKIGEIEGRKEAIESHLEKFLNYRPGGALYCFPRFRQDSYRQALKLAAEKGVIVLPGSIFGQAGEGNVRIAYGSASVEQLERASRLIEEFLEEKSE
ncbi:MAG: pyridoxal phosphate-dependent aminotransferase, partial [Candidatus Odinarchaeota archaeon]